MTTGELIKEKRIALGWTQLKLSEKTGIINSTIGKYERGTLKPKLETLEKIAAALGCPVGDLIGYEIKNGLRTYENGRSFDLAYSAAIEHAKKSDREYIERLSVPALKLNTLGRKVLLDTAESLTDNKDLVTDGNETKEKK